MDAVEFLRKQDRMCKSFDLCDGRDSGAMCELYAKSNKKGLNCADYTNAYPEEAVAIVEKWSKTHPKKTRQSKFLKQFPDAFVYLGSIDIDPCKIVKSKYDTEQCRLRETREWSCDSCREQFWHEEVE